MNQSNKGYHTIIIGGGPAGTGALVYGGWSGRLGELLSQGVALVEAGQDLCVGKLNEYQITSNTISRDFIDFLNHDLAAKTFVEAANSPMYQQFLDNHEEVIPLSEVGEFLKISGQDLARAFDQYAASDLYLGCSVHKIRQMRNGQYEVYFNRDDGKTECLTAKKVVMATGGRPISCKRTGLLVHELAAEADSEAQPLIMSSRDILTEEGLQTAEMWLGNFDDPQVVIIGASHSGFSSAWVLLNLEDSEFEPDDFEIKMVHRNPVKVFYESAEEARSDGFTDFGDDDICPVSGNVYYIAGLRGDAKQLYREVANLGDEAGNDAIEMIYNASIAEGLRHDSIDWSRVALVIFAGGYDFREVHIENPMGTSIRLQGSYTGRYVNDQCKLLDTLGNPIDGLYAVGLGTGFSLTKFGRGEVSFKGQENSVWLCQHDIGESLFNELV
ncbi:FAD-dependent oxidoreductase [Microbulbifer sp. 2304DJ12-6]|uniref:FAD-dependent oxidoreductase n=1 Tax=Microbulbifer sp. 2304DJ12-6 TaxID=3233340 RepID=UPI0039B0756E